MKRTRLSRAEREQQILDTAHALFAERGYEAVTMDEVAAAVGVTKPLLYNYLGNKEQLYLASLERSAAALRTVVLEAVADADGPDEAFRAGVHAFFAFVDSDRDAWRVLFAETLPQSGELARYVGAFHTSLVDVVAATLLDRLEPEQREKARDEIEGLSHAMLGAAESLARWWLRTEAMPAADAAEMLVSTVEPGMRERAHRGDKSSTGEPAP